MGADTKLHLCRCSLWSASWGAKYAGLHISQALDHDKYACETDRYNFPDVTCHENDIKVVASVGDEDLKVDIMNISLPCQVYSEAHITIGKNDKANFEASMSLGPVLDKGKPRVVVFENVRGLWKRRADTNWPNVPGC